jgi:hypothetical protein
MRTLGNARHLDDACARQIARKGMQKPVNGG